MLHVPDETVKERLIVIGLSGLDLASKIGSTKHYHSQLQSKTTLIFSLVLKEFRFLFLFLLSVAFISHSFHEMNVLDFKVLKVFITKKLFIKNHESRFKA